MLSKVSPLPLLEQTIREAADHFGASRLARYVDGRTSGYGSGACGHLISIAQACFACPASGGICRRLRPYGSGVEEGCARTWCDGIWVDLLMYSLPVVQSLAKCIAATIALARELVA